MTTERVALDADIPATLNGMAVADGPRVVVIEGREALLDVSETAREASMHAINTFVRAKNGQQTLVVWPTNTDSLANALVALGGGSVGPRCSARRHTSAASLAPPPAST